MYLTIKMKFLIYLFLLCMFCSCGKCGDDEEQIYRNQSLKIQNQFTDTLNADNFSIPLNISDSLIRTINYDHSCWDKVLRFKITSINPLQKIDVFATTTFANQISGSNLSDFFQVKDNAIPKDLINYNFKNQKHNYVNLILKPYSNPVLNQPIKFIIKAHFSDTIMIDTTQNIVFK